MHTWLDGNLGGNLEKVSIYNRLYYSINEILIFIIQMM